MNCIEPAPVPTGFLVLRTPLLPFEEFLRWTEGVQATDDSLVDDRALLRARLRKIVVWPEIREAIFVASPSLEEGLIHWMSNPDGERGQKVERALVRYFTRMTSRATPFGLFSGCAVGTLGAETRLTVPERSRLERHTRLDMAYLIALTEQLGDDPEIRKTLRYRPNSSIYRAGRWLRYVECRSKGESTSHLLISLMADEYLETTLARAKEGATLEMLATSLAGPGIPQVEAEEYVHTLISSQVLVSDLVPVVTGPEPIHGLIAQLQDRAPIVAEALDQVQGSLEELDSTGLGALPNRYRDIAKELEPLGTSIELSHLFQVDLAKPHLDVSLGPEIVQEVLHGVTLLYRLVPPQSDLLLAFRQKFRERYGARVVPLAEALDDEMGIGFRYPNEASTLSHLEDLPFHEHHDREGRWHLRHEFLLHKLLKNPEAREILLGEEDLNALESKERLPLPDAFDVKATVVGNRDRLRLWIHYAGGPSGARLVGRFCHADPELRRRVEDHLRAEEALRPDSVFAEIVHLPQPRLGNVVCRPALRSYEIPYLGKSGAPLGHQLPFTDLQIALEGDRLALYSQKLGREVIPRLTTALNYSLRGIATYRFLCALQGQGVTQPLYWSWGPLEGVPFLPRVSTGRLILSRATWNCQSDELKELRGYGDVQAWRRVRRIPRFVAITDDDNELVVDFDNILSIESFLDLVKRRPNASLVECFLGPEELVARGPEGHYVHEIVVPFVQTRKPSPAAELRKTPTIVRSFRPGSEWLYLKFYGGEATADRILSEVVAPLVRSGATDRWFFIRYGDPDWHLRVRLHGDRARLLQIVADLPPTPAWKIQVDTYEREIERYGGDVGIELAERLFHADSEAVLQIVEHLSGDEGADARWRLTLRGMDDLLNDLGFDLPKKLALMRRIRESSAKEFHVDGPFEGQLGAKFRKERKSLEELLDRSKDEGSDFSPGFAAFRERSRAVIPIVGEVRAAGLSLEELAPSYLHMHANRLLRSAHRQQEFVLYDFLQRLYESQLARLCPRVESNTRTAPQNL